MTEYRQYNPDSPEITVLLAKSPIYIKTAVVCATQLTAEGLATDSYRDLDVRPDGTSGYLVDIYVMNEVNGVRQPQLEASQPVHPGDWIVANPTQQPGDRVNHYGKTDESFHQRYRASEKPGIYRARGLTRIAKNPTGHAIEITAYWGDQQVGDAECYICAPVDPHNLDDLSVGRRYILSANDYATTYALVTDVFGQDWQSKI